MAAAFALRLATEEDISALHELIEAPVRAQCGKAGSPPSLLKSRV